MQPKTVLIVEDEGIVALDLQTRLKNAGYYVPATFSSGEGFLQNWQKFKPDLVLMDIMLKGTLDGIETTKELRKIASVPVVFLTAYSDNATFEKGKNTDAYGYLIKPVQTRDLLITLEMAIHRQQLEKELNIQKNWNQTILSSLSEGIIVIDAEANIVFSNKEVKHIFGIDEIPTNFQSLSHQLTLEVLEQIQTVKNKRIQVFIPETFIQKEIGNSWVELDIKGVSFDGKSSCLLVFRSLTEKFEARLAISKLEDKYKQLFEQQSAGIFVVELNGKIILSNNTFAQILGFSNASDLKNKNILDYKNPHEFQEIAQKILKESPILQYETTYQTRETTFVTCVENYTLREENGIKTIECVSINISDKKQVEDERDVLAAKMFATIESIENMIWSVDRNYNLTSYNTAFRKVMEYYSIEMPAIGTPFTHLASDFWNEMYAKVFSLGKFQLELVHPMDTHDAHFLYYLSPIVRNDVIIGANIMGVDITEQKSEEIKKKEASEMINSVYKQSEDAIFLMDLSSNKIYDCNKKALEILGVDDLDKIIEPNYLKNLFSHSDWRKLQVRLMKKEEWSGEIQIIQTQEFWGDLHMKPLQIPLISIMLVRVVDITTKKIAERKVKILETAFTSSSEAILIFELGKEQPDILFANKAYSELTGFQLNELIGHDTSIFNLSEIELAKLEQIKQNLFLGKVFEIELMSIKKNGLKYISSNLFSPIINEVGTAQQWVIFTRDITDKKKKEALVIENSLHQQKLLLQTIIDTQEEERLKFSEELHDGIGPTLSALKLNFSTLEKYFTTKEAGKNTFDFTLSLLDSVIQDIRNISHGLMPGSLEYLGLVYAINELCKSFKEKLKINFYAYNFENRIDKSYEITLYRVLQEILNNVIKHAKAQTVDIQLTNLDDVILLTVEDDGVGFDVTDKTKWKGIGLRNIMNRVQLFGGTFTVDSSPDKGTLSIIEFPI